MVKKNLKWAIAPVLAIVLGLSFSSFTDEGEAIKDARLYNGLCPDGKNTIQVCGVGTDNCTPVGVCP